MIESIKLPEIKCIILEVANPRKIYDAEKYVKGIYEKVGCKVYLLRGETYFEKGIPDLLIMKDEEKIYVEVKKENDGIRILRCKVNVRLKGGCG